MIFRRNILLSFIIDVAGTASAASFRNSLPTRYAVAPNLSHLGRRQEDTAILFLLHLQSRAVQRVQRMMGDA